MNVWLSPKRPVIGLAMASALVCAVPADAGERLAGPVTAEVVRVVDGDTIEVRARIWLSQYVLVDVRVRGIDAPEAGGRAKCRSERVKAAEALRRMEQLAVGEVRLSDITEDKYAGRVDADVVNADGLDLKGAMLASGLARPYDGAIRSDWCDLASVNP